MVGDVSAGTDSGAAAQEQDTDALIASGVAAMEEGRRDDAEAAFRKVLAREPNHAGALRRLGVAVYMRGDFQDACGLLELAISLVPDDPDAYNNLAAILLDQGESAEAETYLRRARGLSPDDADINFNLGLILRERGNLTEARSCFEAVLAVRPDDADAHHNLGLTWRRERGAVAAAAAIEAFRRAVAIDGEDCDSLLELSILLREEGCLIEALATSEKALEAYPDDGRAVFNRGTVLYDLGRVQEAARLFQRALSAEPPEPRAHEYLGRALASAGDLEGAIRAFQRGLEALPDDPVLTRFLRDAYSHMVPSWYLPLVNDASRNDAYQKAIEAAVRPDDVVLDIGAGSGLMAMVAARAGASKVIACEPLRPMAEMAKRIVGRNGYDEVITVLAKQSNTLVVGDDLPEPASVVIAENLDVTLIGEGVIPALRHAMRHLACPDARVIPAAARVRGMLIEWPGERAINPVTEVRGFDFRELELFRSPHMHLPFNADRQPHRALSDPFEIAAFDFRHLPDYSAAGRVAALTVPGIETGTGHAVAVWFELDVDGETTVSTRHETSLNHWHLTAQFLDRDLPVTAGRDFRLTVRRTDKKFFFEAGG